MNEADNLSTVSVFSSENCGHYYHVECLRTNAATRMLVKKPNKDFDTVYCLKCGQYAIYSELISALGQQFLSKIEEQ